MDRGSKNPFGRAEFLFIRHGETDWNLEGRTQGHLDIPLNETGLAQAEQARDLLKDIAISYIVSSPLLRARVTADYIAEKHDVPFYENHNLKEANFGVAQGTLGKDWAATWRAGEYCPDQGESYDIFCDRILSGLKEALSLHPDKQDGLPLIVAHGGLYWSLHQLMQIGGDPNLPNATPLKLSFQPDGGWHCEPLMVWKKAVGGML